MNYHNHSGFMQRLVQASSMAINAGLASYVIASTSTMDFAVLGTNESMVRLMKSEPPETCLANSWKWFKTRVPASNNTLGYIPELNIAVA